MGTSAGIVGEAAQEGISLGILEVGMAQAVTREPEMAMAQAVARTLEGAKAQGVGRGLKAMVIVGNL